MNDPALLAFLTAASPLLAFALITFLTRRRPRLSALLSILAVALSFLLSLWILRGELAAPAAHELTLPWLAAGSLRVGLGVLVNPLSALMLVVVTAVSLLVQIYSLGYMRGDGGLARFFSYLSLFTFAMLLLVCADNFVLLYMAWELVGLCSYLLIGFWYHKPEASAAAKKAFVVTRFGDLGFLAGILLLSVQAGSFSFGEAERAIAGGAISAGQVTLIALLLFSGAVGKSGQFPLHVWLPDAMEGPTPVSALIHSATMVAAGVFMVARLYGIFQASADALTVVADLGAFTALFAAALAIGQNDIKRVLAYSTVSQLGTMMLALGAGGYTAGLFHLTTHAAFKTLLFLAAGSIIHAVGTNDLWKMGGLGRRMPLTAAACAAGVLAIAGIFPFSGFWSKDSILEAVRHSGRTGLYIAALLGALLTAFYMARLFFVAFSGAPRGEARAHESPPVMTVPLLILAVAALGLGVIGLPGLRQNIHRFLLPAGGPLPPAEPGLSVPLLSSLLAASGFLGAFLLYGRRGRKPEPLRRRVGGLYNALADRLYIDALYRFLVRRLFLSVSRAIAWFDRAGVDGAVNLVGALSLRSGEALRRTVAGKVQGYALIVFAGLALALAAAYLLTRGAALFAGAAR